MKNKLNTHVAKRIIANVYCAVVGAYMVLWMHLNFPLFLDKLNDAADAPRYDFILLAMAVPIGLVTWRRWFEYLRNPFFLWSLLLLLIYIYGAWRAPRITEIVLSHDDVAEQFNKLQRWILFPIYGYVIFIIGRRRLEAPLLLAAIFIPLTLMLDFFKPELFIPLTTDEITARAEGMYLNPNVSAEATLLTFVLVFRRLQGVWLVLLYLLTGIGIMFTFSRGGIAGWVIIGVMLFFAGRMPRWSWVVPVFILVFYSTFLLFAQEILSSIYSNEDTVAQLVDRLGFFSEAAEDGLTDFSAESRQFMATITLTRSLQTPILGHGFSPAMLFNEGAHNLTLEYWHIYGIAGALVCLSMMWILNGRKRDRVLGLITPESAIFIWLSLFSHTLFTYNYLYVFFAMTLCGYAASSRKDQSPAWTDIPDSGFKLRRRRKRKRRKHNQSAN